MVTFSFQKMFHPSLEPKLDEVLNCSRESIRRGIIKDGGHNVFITQSVDGPDTITLTVHCDYPKSQHRTYTELNQIADLAIYFVNSNVYEI